MNKYSQLSGKLDPTPSSTPQRANIWIKLEEMYKFNKTFWPYYLKWIHSGIVAIQNLLHEICTQMRFTEIRDKPESDLMDLKTSDLYGLF